MTMRNFYHTKQAGFTLVETILYLSLLVVIVNLIAGVGLHVLSSMLAVDGDEELQYNTLFITEKIKQAISESGSILSPLPGQASSTVVLEVSDPDLDPFVLWLEEGSLWSQSGSNLPMELSGEAVSLSEIIFTNVTQSSSTESLNVTFVMELANVSNRSELAASTSVSFTNNLSYP